MRNILAILMMVSFAASAAQESNTEKLNKALATGVSTGKNVLIVSNKITKESPNKEKDREKMNLEMRKLFAEIRTNRSDRSTDNKIKKLRNDFNSKYRYDISFLNKPSFKEYAAKNLVVVNINVGDVKDLPNKLKNDFKVRDIPSVILVNGNVVVFRMQSVARRGRVLPPAWVFVQIFSDRDMKKRQKKEKAPKTKSKPRSGKPARTLLENAPMIGTDSPPLCGTVWLKRPVVASPPLLVKVNLPRK